MFHDSLNFLNCSWDGNCASTITCFL